MTIDSVPTADSAVDRRLRAAGMQLTAIASVGCLIVLVADTQSLALIPLLPQLEKAYALTPSQTAWALSAVTLVGPGWAPTLTRAGRQARHGAPGAGEPARQRRGQPAVGRGGAAAQVSAVGP